METKDIWGTPNKRNPYIIEWVVNGKKLQLITSFNHYRIVNTDGFIDDAYYPTEWYSLDRMIKILSL